MSEFNVRKTLFFINDRFSGNTIGSHLAEITDFFNKDQNSKNQILSDKLSKLLEYAVKSVPFYSEFNFRLGINAFPVIDKNIIRQNYERFISDKFDKKDLIKTVTSGSTGTPLLVYHDKMKKKRNSADTIYFSEQVGYNIGDRLYYLKIWNDINKKSKFRTIAENIIPYDVREQSDIAISNLLKKIGNDSSRKALLGYASAFDSIVRFLEKEPVRFSNIKCCISMSESLSENTKALMEKHFLTKCFSRYSNVENGILAQQLPRSGTSFVINQASYLIEVLKFDNDKPCFGDEPGRIVVTDLYNYGMPMIRYDTGDVGVMDHINMHTRTELVLKTVEGRKMDMIFNSDNKQISSFIITNSMWRYPEIDQYQFIQLSKNEYLFKLNARKKFEREQELIKEFNSLLGPDSIVRIEYVVEIPLLNSGKRKKVVNLMNV